MNNRNKDLSASAGVYKRKFRWYNSCVYCGEQAQCLDHVFPLSLSRGLETWRSTVVAELKQGLNLVPSCNECNSLAGDTPFVVIRNKRQYIQKQLRRKYRKLNAVIWDDDDFKDIGPLLKTHIQQQQLKRARLDLRLSYPYIKR